jgi:hypothetical protein
MSIDVHLGLQPAPADLADTVEGEVERGATWAETAITVIVALITVGFVSFVAVLMAMA